MGKNILLVEPKSRTVYPPLGLMKIATYHKLMGDSVEFVVGKDKDRWNKPYDKIYITSVFTYDFKALIDVVHHYSQFRVNADKIEIGGISATLLADKVECFCGIKPHKGLKNSKDAFLEKVAKSKADFAYLLECGPTIDNLPPDYGIFNEEQKKKYSKVIDNAFFFFATKGCPNKCGFCAVKKLEPKYIDYLPLSGRIAYMRKEFGDRAGLLLLDNNIAASESYERILDEIKDNGFARGDKMRTERNGNVGYKHRFVDFNQGVDLRLMDKKKMKKMAEIAIKPLRLAFDDVGLEERYEEKMRLAIDCGIKDLSNYMLFNFRDKPEDLYRRFQVNMRILADHPDVKIFSFPMRYSPIEDTHRKHIGKHWCKREIRAVQLVLNATHGIVSHKTRFFNRAFGCSVESYKRLLLWPQHYIINRDVYEYENMFIQQWEHDYAQLTDREAEQFREIIHAGVMKELPATNNSKISRLLEHYEGEHANIVKDGVFMCDGEL